MNHEEPLRSLCRRIDDALMVLDQALCERARKEGIPREQISMVDLNVSRLRAMLTAFSADPHLWSQFQREIRGPRDVVFDQVYSKALALGRVESDKRTDEPALKEALSFCDAEGWAKRVNASADHEPLDGLTIHAVAYVLGGNSQARKQFIRAVEEKREPS